MAKAHEQAKPDQSAASGRATLSTAILKIVAVCNLDCSYCYMYHLNDRTFARVPKSMSLSTARRAIDEIITYCDDVGRPTFTICLHGGEPTLWPEDSFAALLSYIRKAEDRYGVALTVALQTNGYRIPRSLIDLWITFGVSIGISIDGPRDHHDLNRRLRSGVPTYDVIMRSVDQLLASGYPPQSLGFLSVAQPSLNPEEYLRWADSLPVRRVDVLWPMSHNHDNPPWLQEGLSKYIEHPTYGTWFADLFELWFRKDDPTLEIRGFMDLVGVLLGAASHGDQLVNDRLPIFGIDTDGTYCYHDYVRGVADGACVSGLNIYSASLSDLAADPVMAYYLKLGDALPSVCTECKHVGVCGGGFLPGRLSASRAPYTAGRSVYCFDQYKLFERVRELVFERPSELRSPDNSQAGPRQIPPLWEESR